MSYHFNRTVTGYQHFYGLKLYTVQSLINFTGGLYTPPPPTLGS